MNNSSTSLANTILGVGLGLGLSLSGVALIAAAATGGEKASSKVATKSDFHKYGTVTAVRKLSKEPTVTITVTGKDGWKVNTEYNAKIVIGDTELRKADGLYKDINKKGDKAESASWFTDSMAKSGTAKFVFCNEVSCTAPTATEFDVKVKP